MAYDKTRKNDKTNADDSRKVKDLLEATVGDFGRWQARISILMALLKFPIAWFQLGIVFLAPPTQFWCKQPEDYKSMPLEQWLKYIAPTKHSNKTNHHISLSSGSCLMKNVDLTRDTATILPCRWGYEYNRTIVRNSIITEFNLVCGKERLVDFTQISFMLGVLLGNIICGLAADKFGRKRVLVVCIFVQSVCGILSAWSPWFFGFLVFRFLLAIANGGTMITSFVMCMEVVGGKWRTIVPILYQIPFGFGNTLMAGLAYYIRDWRHLQLALSGLSGLYVFYLWFVPESPRWLMAIGDTKGAVDVLEKAARINRQDERAIKQKVLSLSHGADELIGKRTKFSVLIGTKELRKRTLLLCLNWLISGITFFAFSQYLGQIAHNLYFAVATGGLIAIPGTVLCVVVIKRYGRRLTTTVFQLLTAACFFVIMFIPQGQFQEDWPRVAFAGLGIIGMSISMPALYLFTGELYPTVLRNAGVGCTVMCARIGSMLAPLVIALNDVAGFLPLTLLGLLATIEALLILPLPETCGMKLPETVEDLQNPAREDRLSDIVNGNYMSVPNNASVEETQH